METTDIFGHATANPYFLSHNAEQVMKRGIRDELLSYANSVEGPVEMC
jgi:hypothetical protein